VDDLIAEQIRYYRARAPEYDETSRPDGNPFAELNDEAVRDLRSFGPVEHAIELGPGTGAFTGVVASMARHLVAVDASPEMLAINAAKVPAGNVERIEADVFAWTPERPADLVVTAFLLSHVPEARFDAFWDQVDRMLAPGGRTWVIDETAHGLWREERYAPGSRETVLRTLRDGRRFQVVKVLWEPDALAERLASIGWEARLVRRDPFYWGSVSRMRR